MNIDWTSTIVMVLYLVITMTIAIYYGKKKTATSNDFTVGGRQFGPVLMFFTMLATIVGAASVIGYTGWYFTRGFSQIWFIIGVSASYLIYIFYLGPRISDFGFQHNGETLGDWMEYRYNRTLRYIASILLIIAYLAITAFQYMAMAKIFNQVTGISYEFALFLTAIIVIVYTSIGGLWAVASTDVLQGAMTLLGIVCLTPIIVARAGGLGNIFASAPAEHLQLFGYVNPVGALSFALVFLLGIVTWPDIWQRCYAAKNKKTLKGSLLTFFFANLLLTGVLVLFLGFSARVLYPGFAAPENILPFMIMDQIPNIWGSLFLAALLAVIMGTADSTLLVCAVMFEKDIYGNLKPGATDEQKLKVNKLATAIGGLLVLILAFTAPSMFDIWVWSADITGATLAVPILLGMCWKKPSHKAAMTAVVLGFVGWTLAQVGLVSWSPILLGSLLSLFGYLLVTIISPQKNNL